MKFGPVPVADAEGSILAHSMAADGWRLKKGRVLTSADLAQLTAAGFETIVVAAPEEGDVSEDVAASTIAQAIAADPEGQAVSVSAAFTGRCNIYAAGSGLVTLDDAKIGALNLVDEAITFATLPAFSRVAPRQMLGTVKIIPYGCSSAAVAAAVHAVGSKPIMQVREVSARTARLILTRTPGMKDSVLDKGAEAVRVRLRALGIALASEAVVGHEAPVLARALQASDADISLILTGSATSDRGDVGPAALIEAGGHLTRFGMPVDPGNLLFLGELNARPVIGLPGCARSPKLNGADWVIERVACGLVPTSHDIASMGVGGLLKEIPSRPQPREGETSGPRRPVVAAIILAAGASSRMRGRDKLLEPVGGMPLLRRVAERVAASSIDIAFWVGRPGDDARTASLTGIAATRIENPRADEGMGTSLSAGVAALPSSVDAAIVVMADMPEIATADLDRLIAGFDPEEQREIIRSVTPDGRAGHPVLFGRRFFESLRALQGDNGARSVVAEHPDFVVDVPTDGQSAVTDLDTPEAWDAWRSAQG